MQTGPRFLTEGDIRQVYKFVDTTTAGLGQTASGYTYEDLGQVGQTGDGRFFRLVQVGGTSAVAPGVLLVAPTPATNSTGLAIPTSQPSNTATGNGPSADSALLKGSYSFNITNGPTAVTEDEFRGGFVEVLQTSGTSEGPVAYMLEGNSAAAASGTITLRLAEPLAQPETLVAGTDTVNLVKNPYHNCEASTTAGVPVGVTSVKVPNTASDTYVSWLQVRGHSIVTGAAAVTLGDVLAQDTSTAGDVVVASAVTQPAVGVATATTSGAGTVGINLTLI